MDAIDLANEAHDDQRRNVPEYHILVTIRDADEFMGATELNAYARDIADALDPSLFSSAHVVMINREDARPVWATIFKAEE